MNKDEILRLAEKFFENKKIELVKPGEIGEEEGSKVEVIFLRTDALDPNVIAIPPDVRVWVDTKSGEVTPIYQL